MDFDNLKNQVSNLTLYDLKAGFRKAQNAVMNYTEMEAKVREATNNEPWGASTTTMQEIANGTFNYAQLSEIMPMIYKRFTEKAAEEWRQIYKALQLLEFLIKNGSERVIDDARSHLSLLKMLRQFHYIDQNGKDQGINVRNRAKELAELLGDVERIRAERKKARSTRNKYGGVEGGAGIGSGASSRYGGFGGETGGSGGRGYGGFSGGVYGDGGGFGGESNEYDEGQSRRDRFEEYDEYDEGGTTAAGRRKPDVASSKRTTAKPEPAKPKEPEVDLFDFGDDEVVAPTASNSKQPSSTLDNFEAADDDDFDEFQSATPQPATTATMAPPQQTSANSIAFGTIRPPPGGVAPSNFSAFSVAPPQTVQSPPLAGAVTQGRSAGFQSTQPNYFGSISSGSGAATPSAQLQQGHQRGPSISTQATPAAKTAPKADPFASLAVGTSKKSTTATKATLADLNKQKANAGLWGASAAAPHQGSSVGDLI
ncbi:hypothetical protein FH972_024351 [Carpinus fangiana]|uniref:ENTH domain-containing protein n=1 Tax=Carpinus fangiana TaxID=176857 RepID=A0A5N6KYI7_9ROSI|nr:hypothetical protein FH972_024351 [Carpinus fangiana]